MWGVWHDGANLVVPLVVFLVPLLVLLVRGLVLFLVLYGCFLCCLLWCLPSCLLPVPALLPPSSACPASSSTASPATSPWFYCCLSMSSQNGSRWQSNNAINQAVSRCTLRIAPMTLSLSNNQRMSEWCAARCHVEAQLEAHATPAKQTLRGITQTSKVKLCTCHTHTHHTLVSVFHNAATVFAQNKKPPSGKGK